ncbi:MAG: phosphate/phosphite/phosphonate ABC transporter substrate-binding protein [Chloroflexi bacterium]|nr:phosphate/phosphite/phosphonate ABC transporter substrate-binding protein [Chloroflexota bacterium]
MIDIRAKFAGLIIGAVIIGGAIACGGSSDADAAAEPTLDPLSGNALTIGDISDEPVKKIERFKPLADYLASELADEGYTRGRVVIAQDMDEMAGLLKSGEVDIFMDSAFPAIAMKFDAESRFLLRRWKGGDSGYWSIFATRQGSGIETLEDLKGHVIAAEDLNSTSGYALPISELINQGIKVKIVAQSDAPVEPDTVGIWFTRDDENTFDAMVQGLVIAGVSSNQDMDKFSEKVDHDLIVFAQTGSVPRQIVSVSKRIKPDIAALIGAALIGLPNTEEGLALLDQAKTAKFDEIPAADSITLGKFESAITTLR